MYHGGKEVEEEEYIRKFNLLKTKLCAVLAPPGKPQKHVVISYKFVYLFIYVLIHVCYSTNTK